MNKFLGWILGFGLAILLAIVFPGIGFLLGILMGYALPTLGFFVGAALDD